MVFRCESNFNRNNWSTTKKPLNLFEKHVLIVCRQMYRGQVSITVEDEGYPKSKIPWQQVRGVSEQNERESVYHTYYSQQERGIHDIYTKHFSKFKLFCEETWYKQDMWFNAVGKNCRQDLFQEILQLSHSKLCCTLMINPAGYVPMNVSRNVNYFIYHCDFTILCDHF